MPKVEVQIGGRERLEPAISKATLLFPTDAEVRIGATSIRGSAPAMRALADALVEAADMADAYDRDPDGFNERERADREEADTTGG
jgi:hypothetical protein